LVKYTSKDNILFSSRNLRAREYDSPTTFDACLGRVIGVVEEKLAMVLRRLRMRRREELMTRGHRGVQADCTNAEMERIAGEKVECEGRLVQKERELEQMKRLVGGL
jgi:hypothetical protein